MKDPWGLMLFGQMVAAQLLQVQTQLVRALHPSKRKGKWNVDSSTLSLFHFHSSFFFLSLSTPCQLSIRERKEVARVERWLRVIESLSQVSISVQQLADDSVTRSRERRREVGMELVDTLKVNSRSIPSQALLSHIELVFGGWLLLVWPPTRWLNTQQSTPQRKTNSLLLFFVLLSGDWE